MQNCMYTVHVNLLRMLYMLLRVGIGNTCTEKETVPECP
jgi:hypothetical protein